MTMVTINIFPPSDASQKQAQNSEGVLTAGPEPVKFDVTETLSANSNPPAPAMQITNAAMENDAPPTPSFQPGSFQDQVLSNDSPPQPTMDFMDLSTISQSAPNPVLSPENDVDFPSDSPAPSLLPPAEDTENSGKSFSKKK